MYMGVMTSVWFKFHFEIKILDLSPWIKFCVHVLIVQHFVDRLTKFVFKYDHLRWHSAMLYVSCKQYMGNAWRGPLVGILSVLLESENQLSTTEYSTYIRLQNFTSRMCNHIFHTATDKCCIPDFLLIMNYTCWFIRSSEFTKTSPKYTAKSHWLL